MFYSFLWEISLNMLVSRLFAPRAGRRPRARAAFGSQFVRFKIARLVHAVPVQRFMAVLLRVMAATRDHGEA